MSSCVNTPQQNGVAERKNGHLLDSTRSFMFQKNVPKSFWGEAVLTAWDSRVQWTYFQHSIQTYTLQIILFLGYLGVWHLSKFIIKTGGS